MRQGTWEFIAVGSGTVLQIAPSSDKRARLEVWAVGGTLYVTDTPNAPAGTGIPVAAPYPLVLDKETHGDMLHHAWFGSATTVGVSYGAIDVQEMREGSM